MKRRKRTFNSLSRQTEDLRRRVSTLESGAGTPKPDESRPDEGFAPMKSYSGRSIDNQDPDPDEGFAPMKSY